MTYRVGIDIGGTFTDFTVLDDRTGDTLGFKWQTNPANPAEGLLAGLKELSKRNSIPLDEITYFVHGQTIGLNALLEHRGAKLAMLVTKGFRDVLELQRLRLSDPMNFNSTRPVSLIPRQLVLPIEERILTDGQVETPIDEANFREALREIREAGLRSVVVCFINSYRNPVHERRVREIAQAEFPELYVCSSAEVWPQIREYERAMVAVINAYIRPNIIQYLESLIGWLGDAGVKARPYITKSNGGIMTVDAVKDLPVQTLLSGPASGVIGAIACAKDAGFPDILTLDMGGTSADIAVVRDGEAYYSQEEHIGDFPIVVPTIGVSAIGAGGGSIAWIDQSGVLKVGPKSAGANPGPACYDRGGTDPTLTDAFLVSGYLNPDNFAGGDISLSVDQAAEAVARVAGQMRLSVPEVADGIVEVATANMFAEFSQILAKHGIDPRDFTLVAFGGAGAIQACFLAAEFHIPRVLIPLSPGTLCALGSLNADIRSDYIKSMHVRLGDGDIGEFRRGFAELVEQAEKWVATEAPAASGHKLLLAAGMRYQHQAVEIKVSFEIDRLKNATLKDYEVLFHEVHQQLYGYSDSSVPVEVVTAHVTVVATTPKTTSKILEDAVQAPEAVATRDIRIGRKVHKARIYRRGDLRAKHEIPGPAIIEQADTTVLIPNDFAGVVDRFGNLIISRCDSKKNPERKSSKKVLERANG